MTEIDILHNQKVIIDCAKAFRYDANNLMNELASEFNFSLEATELFPKEIYNHKFKNKGDFRQEWTYYFHGAECRFDNFLTGQVVELIYITKPEFGFLDGYFFHNYMVTTGKFKNLAGWFGDYKNVWIAIELLADKGALTRDTSQIIRRNIIAL